MRNGARAGGGDGDLDAVAQVGELVPHVPRAGQGALLQVILASPDVAEVGVDPLVPDVEEGEVVPSFANCEAVTRRVGEQFLVLGPVEQS